MSADSIDRKASSARFASAGNGDEEYDTKRLRDMMSDFGGMKIDAAVSITQDHSWFQWDGVVVVGLFPSQRGGCAWAVGFQLKTSQLIVTSLGVEFEGVTEMSDNPTTLENSQRWSNKISHAEAAAEDYDLDHVGKAKVEFCVDLCVWENQLLGVDVGGLYQVWDLLTGKQAIEGRFSVQHDGVECYVRMNAICMTPNWIIGVTCLDDHGSTSTLFAVDMATNTPIAPLEFNVTGVRHLSLDAESPHIVWMATDSGPFFVDTRFPHTMWAVLPGGRWIEALGVVDDMMPAMDVGRYVSRFDQCVKDLVYRDALLDYAADDGKKTSICGSKDTVEDSASSAGCGDYTVVCTKEKVAADIKLAEYFNTKRYRVLDADIRPHFLKTERDGQLIAIGEACFSWTSMHDMKIVPGKLGGLLCGTFVPGGLVFVHEDRKIYMVQAPWATRQTDKPDSAEKVIARTFDAGETSVTRISDAPNVDCNNMIVAVSDTTLLVHAADDGVYRFDVTSSPLV